MNLVIVWENTKYNKADVFTLGQKELKLAYAMDIAGKYIAMEKLSNYLGRVRHDIWLTRGSEGAYGIQGHIIQECPAFTLTVKDIVGAGNAFYAIARLYAAVRAPTEFGTFMRNIAGALGANIVGNKEAVENVNVLKYASTLLNI